MFKKKKVKINPNTTDTIVGEGSIFEGRIKSQASLRIEGQINGDIECEGDVVIGENGNVRSNITARNVTIAGQVHGNVITAGMLSITSSGQLYGNISAKSFTIEEGGMFQGNSKMDTGEKKPSDSSSPAVSAPSPSPSSSASSSAYNQSTYNSSSSSTAM